jgi:release factor glutamine methyltransferase
LRRTLKYLIARTYKPALVKYLSKTRMYTYKGIELLIPSQVFHPVFFFSTKLLLQYLSKMSLFQKSFLELGAGSGLISFYASRQGAMVTATDINPVAIEFLHKNMHHNGELVKVLHSDLFSSIPPYRFDIIAINPPYYMQDAHSQAEFAWFCGKNGEYFERLFGGLGAYTHADSLVLLVLCDGCDIQRIKRMAEDHGLCLKCVVTQQTVLEKNFIFRITC